MENWLTREQTKELLAVPDRSTLKGKRDYCILALLVGCALRRHELTGLKVEEIQLWEGRWVIADMRGKRWPCSDRARTDVGQASGEWLDDGRDGE